MVEKKPITVCLLTSYSSASFEVLSKLLESNVVIAGVLFAPANIQRVSYRQLIKNSIRLWRYADPGFLLKQHGVPFSFVDSHNGDDAVTFLKDKRPDLIVLYGTKIIKPHVLEIPTIGTLNSHSALLPHYRGGSAEFWMLYNNEPQYAGVTVHWVTPNLDEGDIILQEPLTVTPHDTPLTLREKSVPVAAQLFVNAIRTIAEKGRVGVPQVSTGAPAYRKPSDIQRTELKRRLLARNRTPQQRISAAIRWLQYSGIQNPPFAKAIEGKNLSGSFNSWYDIDKGTYAYVYPEISGYAATMFAFLLDSTRDHVFLQRAIQVGDWLVSIQDASGGFPTALYRAVGSTQKPDEFHTFDAGMILNGLVLLHQLTQKETYLVAARRAADWILSYQKTDGTIAAQISKETGAIQDTEQTWSTQRGPHHIKIAIGLLNLYEATKETRYQGAAILLCEYGLRVQNSTGSFYTYGALVGTNLHPHLYAAEGLYVAGLYLHEKKYLDASKRAVEWAFSHAQKGLVPRHQHEEALNFNERVDVLSQALRLAVLHNIDNPDLEHLAEIISSYQYFRANQSQTGGFAFGKLSDGTPAPHLNSWVTMFALQALMLQNGTVLQNPFLLV